MTLRQGPGRANFRGIIARQTDRGFAHTSCEWPLRFQPATRLRSLPMSLPVPTRTAAWALPYVLGMATLVVGCSKTERPDVAIRQTTLAAQTPATPAAPADTADNRFLSFDAATNKVTFLMAAGPFVF